MVSLWLSECPSVCRPSGHPTFRHLLGIFYVKNIPSSTLKVPTSNLRNKENSVKKVPNICPFECPDVRPSVRLSYVRPSVFSFPDDNLSKCKLIFPKLRACHIVKVCLGIVNGQISSIFDRVICPQYVSIFHFRMITLVNINGFSQKLGVCIDIVETWFGIADGKISSIFGRVICPQYIRILL